jgi:hypothetical protein
VKPRTMQVVLSSGSDGSSGARHVDPSLNQGANVRKVWGHMLSHLGRDRRCPKSPDLTKITQIFDLPGYRSFFTIHDYG